MMPGAGFADVFQICVTTSFAVVDNEYNAHVAAELVNSLRK